MQELVHGHDQPPAKAARVQVHGLVPTRHTQLAFAVLPGIDRDVVGALGLGGDKGDAGGEEVGQVVHRLPCQVLQLCEKYSCCENVCGKSFERNVFKKEWQLTWRE